MDTRGLLRLLLVLLPIGPTGSATVPVPSVPATTSNAYATVDAPSFVSPPRQSLPTPTHDEATCAFCQAATFAPHGATPAGGLPVLADAELHDAPTREGRLTSSASGRPPRSRAPPTLRDV